MVTDSKSRIEAFLCTAYAEPAEVTLADDLTHGDLTTNLALRLASRTGQAASELAQEISNRLQLAKGLPTMTVTLARPGFVNIRLGSTDYQRLAARIEQTETALSHQLVGQTYLVEYSQPNIAKPMHLGHLRTTILGESIKRLFAAAGAQAIGINHLGDWGSQFGKLLAAYKRWGQLAELQTGGIQEMLRLYVAFHTQLATDPTLASDGAREFARLEAGDPANRQLWARMRSVSLQEFERLYARLGIHMDDPVRGESDFVPALGQLIATALARGIAIRSDGAVVIPVGDELPPCLIQKSDGATLYATRDLAAIHYRMERWQPDRIFYVVAADQSLHFQQVFQAAQQLGFAQAHQLVHVPYGLVSLPEGKMSTRAGRVVFLDDVLAEAVERSSQLLAAKSPDLPAVTRANLAEQIGVSAVKYQMLQPNRMTTIVFAMDKIVSLQGNTGPYLQYAVARMQSLLRKAGPEPPPPLTAQLIESFSADELTLLRFAVRLPWVVERAAAAQAPNQLADWAYRLASLFNTFYETAPVLQAEPARRAARLALVRVMAAALTRALQLLTLATPDRL